MARATDISLLALTATGRGSAAVSIESDDIVIGVGDSQRTTRAAFTRAQAVAIADAIYEAAGENEDQLHG